MPVTDLNEASQTAVKGLLAGKTGVISGALDRRCG